MNRIFRTLVLACLGASLTPQVNAGFVNVGNVSAGSMVTIANVGGAPDKLVDTVTFSQAQPTSMCLPNSASPLDIP